MDSLKQYTDLYDDNLTAVDAGSSPVLNALRPGARSALRGISLPKKGNEGFAVTDINAMAAPDLGVNISRLDMQADVASSFRCGVPNLSSLMGIVVNDTFHPTAQLLQRLPDGVLFMSLRKAADLYPELVKQYYGKLAASSSPGVALNTMLVQDGTFLYVKAGVRLEKPLQLVSLFSSAADMAAFRRLLVVMEAGSSAQLLVCDHTRDTGRTYLSSAVTEIFLGRGSTFDLYDIEETSLNTSRYSQMFATQASGSRLLVSGTTLTCGATRNDMTVNIEGDGCETTLAGLVIASDGQSADYSTRLTHSGKHSRSRQIFKYVLDGNAKGAFEGLVTVDESAVGTEASQTDKNLLACPAARMHTEPQLLINCDDVKCSHGASTGQLDAEALFYMRQRGIDERTARTMLMQAFASDVVDLVKMPGLQDRLHHLVENRFLGNSSNCGDCNAECISAL